MQISRSFLQYLTLICLIAVLHNEAISQSKIAINGVVKSAQGLFVSEATVSIHNQQDELLKTVTTSADGQFKTDKSFKADQTVIIKVSKPGFSDKSVTHRVRSQNGTSNAGEIQLTPHTIITGFVSDSVTLEPVQGAEVSFFDASGRLIQSRSTNMEGYFEFETDFTFEKRCVVKLFYWY